MTKQINERRDHPRLAVRIPIEYKCLSDFFVDYAVNISHGGMFVATDKPVEVGTPVNVKFKLPEEEDSFEASGVVVRFEGKPDSGVGIKFNPLGSGARAAIERLWEKKMKE